MDNSFINDNRPVSPGWFEMYQGKLETTKNDLPGRMDSLPDKLAQSSAHYESLKGGGTISEWKISPTPTKDSARISFKTLIAPFSPNKIASLFKKIFSKFDKVQIIKKDHKIAAAVKISKEEAKLAKLEADFIKRSKAAAKISKKPLETKESRPRMNDEVLVLLKGGHLAEAYDKLEQMLSNQYEVKKGKPGFKNQDDLLKNLKEIKKALKGVNEVEVKRLTKIIDEKIKNVSKKTPDFKLALGSTLYNALRFGSIEREGQEAVLKAAFNAPPDSGNRDLLKGLINYGDNNPEEFAAIFSKLTGDQQEQVIQACVENKVFSRDSRGKTTRLVILQDKVDEILTPDQKKVWKALGEKTSN